MSAKTVSMKTISIHEVHFDPEIYSDRDNIPVLDKMRIVFLALILIIRCRSVTHLTCKEEILKALFELCAITHLTRSVNTSVMLQCNQVLYRSKSDY